MSVFKLEKFIKEYVTKVFLEFSEKKFPDELNVYDFDDTLIETDGVIHLINTVTGEQRELHPHEFHEYELGPDEEFDLTDFTTMVNPIKLPHLSRLKSDYARLGPLGVAICTARPSTYEIEKFMADEGVGDIEMVATGLHSPPKGKPLGKYNARKKKEFLKKKLQQRKLKILRFFDDNELNCTAAQSLVKEFPNVLIEVELVR